MINRAPSPATVRRQAGLTFHRRVRDEISSATQSRATPQPAAAANPSAPTPHADQVQLADLPYLTRRVLRIITIEPGIRIGALDVKADLDPPGARPHADSLVLLGLVTRDDALYTLTHAGMHALQASAAASDHDLARRAAAYLKHTRQ